MKIPVINNWSTTGVHNDPYLAPDANPLAVQGHVRGRDGFEDGSRIVTSAIVDFKKDRWGHLIFTHSGSRYRLGIVDPKWVQWMKDHDVEFDPNQPIRRK